MANAEGIMKTAKRVAATVNAMIDKYEQDQLAYKGGIKGLLREIEALLLKENLAYVMRVPPEKIGPHPTNRYGSGLIPCDVHDLMEIIIDAGWDPEEVKKARAVEMPPISSKRGKAYRQWLKELTKSTEGHLSTYDMELFILSLTCGHTTGGLRSIKMKAKALHKTISDENGHLSLARLRERSPLMADAVENGMEWFIMRWEVEELMPRLMNLVQEAGNLDHQASRVETPAQVMLSLHAKVKSEDVPDWDRISKVLQRQKPRYKDDADGMVKFVKAWAGGAEPIVLKRLDAHYKALSTPRRVTGSVWDALAGVDMPSLALYVQMCVMACTTSPGQYVREGNISKLLNTHDIGAATSARLLPHVKQGMKMMEQGMQMLDKHETLTEVEKQMKLGTFALHLIMHIHQKSKHFKTFPEIGNAFWEDIGRPCKCPPEWKCENPTTAKESIGRLQMRELSVKKGGLEVDPASEIANKGFSVGVAVKNRTADTTYVISKITKSIVTLTPSIANQKDTDMNVKDFVNDFIVIKRANDNETLAFSNPAETMSWSSDDHKAVVRCALTMAFESYIASHKAVGYG